MPKKNKRVKILFFQTVITILANFNISKIFAEEYGSFVFEVQSTDGYNVKVMLTLIDLIAPDNCINGYNYDISVGYDISFSGKNLPNNLYNLQGYLICGNSSIYFDLPNINNENVSGISITDANVWTRNTDCATSTPLTFDCNNIDLVIQGPGINHQVIRGVRTTLPITLDRFDIHRSGTGIEIEWSTLSEKNNDFFTLERSSNGVDFYPIYIIDGAGHSNVRRDYNYIDTEPLQGYTYYRLKQTDFNGDFEYFPIKGINGENTINEELSLTTIWPIPFNENINIAVTSNYKKVMYFRVVDFSGGLVRTGHLNINKGINKYEVDDLKGLSSGIYFIHFDNNVVKKIIKQ